MMSSQRKRAEDLFQVAVDSAPAERSRFLDEECGTDAALREEVEELLRANERVVQLLRVRSDDRNGFLDPVTMSDPAKSATDGKPQRLSSDQLPERMGDYAIQDEIGRGGMGRVYLAVDTKLDRQAAIKLLPDKFSNDAHRVALFKREAITAAHLNHPNIATIYGFHELEGRHYLAMEYVEGRMLSDLLKEEEPVPLLEFLDIAVQMAEGLSAAHRGNVVHRDLKPGNVMITDESLVKILDFGLAKAMLGDDQSGTDVTGPEDLSERSMAFGTIGYSSPEQCDNGPVDFRSDLFSFGVVLYELATGIAPFRRDTFQATYWAVLKSKPEPERSLNPHVPPKVAELIERLLEKQPEDRFQSSEEVLQLLKRYKRRAEAKHYGKRRRRQTAAVVVVAVSIAIWAVVTRKDVDQVEIDSAFTIAERLIESQEFLAAVDTMLHLYALDPDDAARLERMQEDVEAGLDEALLGMQERVSGYSRMGKTAEAERYYHSVVVLHDATQRLRPDRVLGGPSRTVIDNAIRLVARTSELIGRGDKELELAQSGDLTPLHDALVVIEELDGLGFDEDTPFVPAQEEADQLRERLWDRIADTEYRELGSVQIQTLRKLLDKLQHSNRDDVRLQELYLRAAKLSAADDVKECLDEMRSLDHADDRTLSTDALYNRLYHGERLRGESRRAFKDGYEDHFERLSREWVQYVGPDHTELDVLIRWREGMTAVEEALVGQDPDEAQRLLNELTPIRVGDDLESVRLELIRGLNDSVREGLGTRDLIALEHQLSEGLIVEAEARLAKLDSSLHPDLANRRSRLAERAKRSKMVKVQVQRLKQQYGTLLARIVTDRAIAEFDYEDLELAFQLLRIDLDKTIQEATGSFEQNLLLSRANLLLWLGDYAGSLRDTKRTAESVEVLLIRGCARYCLAATAPERLELMEEFIRAAELDEESARAHYWLGVCEPNADKARGHFQRVIELELDCADTRLRLAELEIERGDFHEALEHGRQAIEGAITFDAVLATFGGTEKAVTSEVVAGFRTGARALCAGSWLGRRKYAEALPYLSRVVREGAGMPVLEAQYEIFRGLLDRRGLASEAAEPYRQRMGVATRLLDNLLEPCWRERIAWLTREIGGNSSTDLLLERAFLFLRVGSYAEALTEAQSVGSAEGYILAAQAKFALAGGERSRTLIEECLKLVEKAALADPSGPTAGIARYLEGAFRYELGSDGLDRSLTALEQATGDAGLDSAGACSRLAMLYFVSKRDAEAESAADRALEAGLNEEEILVGLGGPRAAVDGNVDLFWRDVFLRRAEARLFLAPLRGGDYADCIEDCSEAISLDPGYAYGFFLSGSAKGEAGDSKGALKDLEKSIRLVPKQSVLRRDVKVREEAPKLIKRFEKR